MAAGTGAELETVQLAALLHDIGKFWQRTGAARPDLARELADMEVGAHGAHARWSAAFIEQHVPPGWRRAAWPALMHHRPPVEDRATRVVALADRLAAAERRPLEEEGEVAGPRQVRSLLAGAAGRETAGRPRHEAWYYPLAALGAYTEQTLFPRREPYSAATRDAAYRHLWDGFVAEHARLPSSSFAAYFSSLYALLQKYTWCIPSAYYGAEPDVSLFDHARVTCALATCLWRDAITDTDLAALLAAPAVAAADGSEAAEAAERFLLVGGDVSGVQRFLYTISSAGALRGLRGRSFYLQLLAEAIVRFLLRAWELPPANVIYEGGGHFFLLAPYGARESLRRVRRRLTQVLLAHHRGELFVALAAVPLSAGDLRAPQRLTAAFRRLSGEIAQAKRRKGDGLTPEEQAVRLFSPLSAGGLEHQYCRVCRGPIDDAPAEAPAEDDPRRKCRLCHGLEDLGDRLRRGSALLLWEHDAPEESGPVPGEPAAAQSAGDRRGGGAGDRADWQPALRALGLGAAVLQQTEQGRLEGAPDPRTLPADGRVTLQRLQDADVAAAAADAARLGFAGAAAGFRLLAQSTPESAQEPGTVADFAELAEASTGVERLGFLRADVDNLGELFLHGLSERDAAGRVVVDRATLSRRAALSFSLRLFFEGHLSVLCDRWNPRSTPGTRGSGKNDERDRLYLIYGGGDDVFLTGGWNAVAEAAGEIAASLGRFAGENPAVHLSAGITLHPPKYPVYQAAREAGEALDAAKDRPGKNAVTFLGQTVGWGSWQHAAALARQLGAAVAGEPAGDDVPAPRALLQLALRLCRQAADERRRRELPANQLPWGRWMWRGAYTLARRRPALAPIAGEIEARLLSAEALAELAVAAAWADLSIRKTATNQPAERGRGSRGHLARPLDPP